MGDIEEQYGKNLGRGDVTIHNPIENIMMCVYTWQKKPLTSLFPSVSSVSY